MPRNNNNNCSKLSHAVCKQSRKCQMQYKYKNGTFTSTKKGKGQVLNASCVNNPNANNRNNRNRNNSNKNNKLNSRSRNNNNRSRNNNNRSRKNNVSCSKLSHRRCREVSTCHLDTIRNGKNCSGSVKSIRCIPKNQPLTPCNK